MLQALTDLNAYQTAHNLTNSDLLAIGDINQDYDPINFTGGVNNLDIQAMLGLLIAAQTPPPDPPPPDPPPSPPPAPLTATLSNSGVLTIADTSASDRIVFHQSAGQISIDGISGSWTTTKVKSVVVSLSDGNDFISLDSLANGGTQTFKKKTTVNSGLGNEHVTVVSGHDVIFSGLSHVLVVATDGSATLDGAAVVWQSPPPQRRRMRLGLIPTFRTPPSERWEAKNFKICS